MNNLQTRRSGDKEFNKFRMTYERAGELFNVFQHIPSAKDWNDIIKMNLKPPTGKFSEFLEANKDKLQLFDEEPAIISVCFGTDDDGEFFPYHVELKPPTGKFSEFIEDNKDKLQLFDEEPISITIGRIHVCIYESDLPF